MPKRKNDKTPAKPTTPIDLPPPELRSESAETIAAWMRVLVPSGSVELRYLGLASGESLVNQSGVYSHERIDKLAAAAAYGSGHANGVYFTVNPLREEAANSPALKGGIATRARSARDVDIAARRYVVFDVDTIRPPDVSATEEERTHAGECGERVKIWMEASFGVLPYAVVDSGNGLHVYYLVELPATFDIGPLLKTVAAACDNERAKVDCVNKNASRVFRVPGTLARKGPDTPERPWRIARLTSVADVFTPLTADAISASLPLATPPARSSGTNASPDTSYALRVQRARAYANEVEPGIQGSGGSKPLVRLVNRLLDFGLSDDDAMAVLSDYSARCVPPWDDADLSHALTRGKAQPRREIPEREGNNPTHDPLAAYAGAEIDGILASLCRVPADPLATPPPTPDATAGDIEYTDDECGNRVLCDAERARILRSVFRILKRQADAASLPFFRRGSALASVHRDSSHPHALAIVPFTEETLATWLTGRIIFYKISEKKSESNDIRCEPPVWLAKTMMMDFDKAGVRHLNTISTVPILLQNGTILSAPGYHASASCIIDECARNLVIPDLSGMSPDELRSTAHDALSRVERVLLCAYPFQSEADRSAALALLLTPFFLQTFPDKPALVFVITANLKGTGKTTLAKIAGILATGQTPAPLPYSTDENRMTETLDAVALSGSSFVIFDEVRSTIGTGQLNTATIEKFWLCRPKYTNTNARVPWNVTWVATGNNITAKEDFSRRVQPIRLRTSDSSPHTRTGLIDLCEYSHAHRACLVADLLTSLAAFLTAGQPLPPVPSQADNFIAWRNVVRASLVWAGFADPQTAVSETAAEGDDEGNFLHTLIAGLAELGLTTSPFSSLEIITRYNGSPVTYETLGEAFSHSIFYDPRARDGVPSAAKLGMVLAKYANRRIDNGAYITSSLDTHTRSKQWKVTDQK